MSRTGRKIQPTRNNIYTIAMQQRIKLMEFSCIRMIYNHRKSNLVLITRFLFHHRLNMTPSFQFFPPTSHLPGPGGFWMDKNHKMARYPILLKNSSNFFCWSICKRHLYIFLEYEGFMIFFYHIAYCHCYHHCNICISFMICFEIQCLLLSFAHKNFKIFTTIGRYCFCSGLQFGIDKCYKLNPVG